MADMNHLAILPILVPMMAAIANILLGDQRSSNRITGINIAFGVILVGVAVLLLVTLVGADRTAMAVYPLGNWPVPFGIVLVADRLSAVMVLTTSILSLAAMVYASARWYRSSPNFFPLFHAMTMGLNGAFLTGDLFNLFVFFELLLAASYGLALHGGGRNRVRSALHYIAINLVASSLFLIGVALIYGSAGTLNMADIARVAPSIAPENRGLFEAGAAILGIAFLIKAGSWPLHFWLPHTYSAATPPVGAIFAAMTKVGFYSILRLWNLVFANQPGPDLAFGQGVLMVLGLATIAYGSVGALASKALDRLASYLILVSAGTLLLAVSLNTPQVTTGALYYFVVATLAAGAMFLLKDVIDQILPAEAQILAVSLELYGDEDEQLDDDEEVSRTVPGSATLVTWCFAIVALLMAGLPPLSGFLAKFAMISGAFSGGIAPTQMAWWFTGAVIVSGFFVLVDNIRLRSLEVTPIVALLALCVFLSIVAGPVVAILGDAAMAVHSPDAYIGAVMQEVTP